MTAFVIMCGCLIALYASSRWWPPAQPFEDRIGWAVAALFLFYVGVQSWSGSIDVIRDGYFMKTYWQRSGGVSPPMIVWMVLDPNEFWTHIANSLLVCSTLIYLSTLALRRALKRS